MRQGRWSARRSQLSGAHRPPLLGCRWCTEGGKVPPSSRAAVLGSAQLNGSAAVVVKVLRFVSLLLVALIFGLALCHVMEMPGKLRLNGTEWLTVQQNLCIA